MNKIDPQKIQLHQTQKWDIKIGDYLSKGFEIYKKEWVNYSLFSLLSLIIAIVAGATIIGMFFVALPLSLGYAVASEKVENNEKLSLNDFFKPFDKTMQLFMLALIIIGVIFVGYFIAALPLALTSSSDTDNPLSIFSILIFFIISLVIMLFAVFILFAPYLVYFGNYSASDAIKTSIKLGKQNALMIFLFLVVNGIIGQLGAIACYVGMFVTLPISSIAMYLMVKDAILTTTTENDNFNNLTTTFKS